MALPRPGRCVVIGVLNVTPDSFSDGGRFLDRDDAVAHGVALRAAGADLVDVGGESTRPGAGRIEASVECARVLPVIRARLTLAVERGELAHDALARFPQLLVAPALLAVLWSGLFGRFAPLDARELMRAHLDLLFGKDGAPKGSAS